MSKPSCIFIDGPFTGEAENDSLMLLITEVPEKEKAGAGDGHGGHDQVWAGMDY